MKQLLLTIFFALAFAASVIATPITVSSYVVTGWQYGGSTAKLRIYAGEQFQTSDGNIVMPGSPTRGRWYKEITCSVSGTSLTIPQTVIDSTTDSDIPRVTYTAIFFDSNGVQRDVYMPDFRMPSSYGSTITWAQIRTFNLARPARLATNYYTADQVNTLLSTLAIGGGTWGSITGTLSAQTDLNTALSGKQATLVSGTNIKTINTSSLLGAGNLTVGITNSAGSNVLMKSDGTNAVASTITDDGTNVTFANPGIFTNTGLWAKDVGGSFRVNFKPGSTFTANRTLTFTTGDANRTLTFAGDATISGTNTGDQTTISGNAGTATALAANGTNCSAGSYSRGVDASGNAENCTADSVGTPGGSDTQIQYNNASAFGGSANLVWDNTNKLLTLGNSGKRFEIGVDSSYNAIFGHAFSASDNILQYEFKYYSAGTASTKGLKLNDVGAGTSTILNQLGAGVLYVTDGAGTPGSISVGLWTNPNDGTTFTAGSGKWYMSAGKFGIGGNVPGSQQLYITVGDPTYVGQVIKLAASQTANAFEVQTNGSGTPTSGIDRNGISFGAFGAAVASAATITATGNLFHVTGTTNITSISGTNVVAGTCIKIIFDGILTFTDGSNLKLATSFTTSADDVWAGCYDGANWYESSRSVN